MPLVSGHEIFALTAAPQPARTNAPVRRHPGLSAPAIGLFAVLVVLVLALAAGGLRAAGIGAGPNPAEQAAAARATLQAELRPQFDALMGSRSTFLAAERKYQPAMKQTRAALKTFATRTAKIDAKIRRIETAAATQLAACRIYRYVACPDPAYPASPDAPDLSHQVAQLRAVARSMAALHAELIDAQPISQLEPAYAELLRAVDTLRSNAKQNANLLADAVSAPDREGGVGYVHQSKLKGLTGNDALASSRQLNRTLVAVLAAAQLPVAGYDLS